MFTLNPLCPFYLFRIVHSAHRCTLPAPLPSPHWRGPRAPPLSPPPIPWVPPPPPPSVKSSPCPCQVCAPCPLKPAVKAVTADFKWSCWTLKVHYWFYALAPSFLMFRVCVEWLIQLCIHLFLNLLFSGNGDSFLNISKAELQPSIWWSYTHKLENVSRYHL